MNPLRRFARRLRSLLSRSRVEADMAEEMRFHLEERTTDRIADGLPVAEARFAAQRKFGNVGLHQEHGREARGFLWFDQLGQDLRYATRQLRRSPAFATTAILILALGIGATTAIFSVVNGILLKPLPYEQPGQLVQLFEASAPGGQNAVSPGVFTDWREQNTQFEGVAAYTGQPLNFTGGGTPERVNGIRMSINGLSLLRAHPLVGRVFAPDEDLVGKNKVLLITNQLWQRRYGGDRDIVGRTVLLNDETYHIVGVLPDNFLPFTAQEFVLPFAVEAKEREVRGGHYLRVLARLKPGATVAQAQAELDALSLRSKPLYPAWKRDWGVTVIPMHEQLVQNIKPALLVLLGAVGLVLLIACTNVANLLLAKASVRQKEIALRAALGASRGRIIRQLLVESLFLSLIGAGLGLLLAFWSVGGLRHLFNSMGLARSHEVTLDPFVLVVALAVSVLTGLAFGLAPALQASRPALTHALKDAARGSGTSGKRLRGALIVGEVALALVLLIGAGLLLHSFFRLMRVPPGFTADHALTLQLSLSKQKYPDTARRATFYNRVAERIAALPGVEAAGLTQTLPLRGGVPDVFFRLPGRAGQPEREYDLDLDFCTPDFFRALGIPLLRGRNFTPQEVASGARVALINAAAVRELFPDEDPLGRQLVRDNVVWGIIGVVGDVRMRTLSRPARSMVYQPGAPGDAWWGSASLVVRTRTSPLAIVESVRQAMKELDADQPLANIMTLEEVVASSIAERRLTLTLLAAFAGVALVLAAIGLYGVIAYAVTQRTREFGIRVALGASRGAVLRLVLGHSLQLVALGLVLGLVGAFALTGLLTKLLYEIKPTDPLTFLAVSLLLLATALLASWLPARRAATVDPMLALRCE
jgi:predicted permease